MRILVTISSCHEKQRTNGPINAHLRSATYTNKQCLNIVLYSPSARIDEAPVTGVILFQNNQYSVQLQFHASFSLQMTRFSYSKSMDPIDPRGVAKLATDTYQISKLWALWFRRRLFFFICPINGIHCPGNQSSSPISPKIICNLSYCPVMVCV